MKIIIVLIFTAFICGTKAQLISGLGAGIKELRKIIDEQLEQAEKNVQTAYNQANERVERAYGVLEEASENARDRVEHDIDNIQENVEKQVNPLIQNAKEQDIDVNECKVLVQSFNDAGDTVVNETVLCFTSKIQEGKNITTNIRNIGQESLDVIGGIRQQSNDCVENIGSFLEQISAAACLATVRAKATWALSTKIPAIVSNIAQATILINTLQSSISYCLTKNSITNYKVKGDLVVADVRKCVAQRIESAQVTSTPKVPEEGTITTKGLVLPEFEEVLETDAPGTNTPKVPEEGATTTKELVLPEFEEVPETEE